ncbi:DNA-directed RNA polymerase I subunit RPA43-like isoform X2 [Monomorium pharaonis]|uniref:DNA-directed RNA polymerase I subunit RPA43-like isoform X2 n=1 Tax=Monomorium pharaonis TaxID=307658 RepID=UPI001746A8F9|nr:DNA-directed RNA polymerase I subunit RPA43-like isoform X2 [Monomorium pharaonis]
MNREVTWSSLELSELLEVLEDEESHVHFTRTIKHLALHPYHLNNVQRGVNHILRSSLNTYDKELKGFVLAFRNPKLLSNLGEILYDSPFIHIDVEADFYLFCPTIGTFLKGIVNKKGLDHIVVLVHKIYTISIPKPDDIEEWLGDLMEIGQEVKCCMVQLKIWFLP